MTILAFFLGGIASVLHIVLNMLQWIVIIRVLLSWVNPDPYNPIVRFLSDVTDPMLKPIRRYVPLVGPGLDLSPIILLLAIVFLDYFLVGVLSEYAIKLRMAA